jgi:hypothetical protein
MFVWMVVRMRVRVPEAAVTMEMLVDEVHLKEERRVL